MSKLENFLLSDDVREMLLKIKEVTGAKSKTAVIERLIREEMQRIRRRQRREAKEGEQDGEWSGRTTD